MVARTPPKQQRKMAVPPPLNPNLLRETVNKVDKCMARLQELQNTVNGGTKMNISGNRNYLQKNKHQALRFKNTNSGRSPGKMPTNAEEWRRMSLPAMLLGETMGEIIQATKFATTIVQSVTSSSPSDDDPKTPITQRKAQKPNIETSQQLHSRRKREKRQTIQSESATKRAKTKINFKASKECDKENCKYIANRISPRNQPWAKKTVLFPNQLFHSSSPTSQKQNFFKSPMIGKSRQVPHKFLVKSPPSVKKIKTLNVVCASPTKAAILSKKSPPKASKFRRSFSPSRMVNRMMSPLRGRKSAQKNEGVGKMGSGVKQQRPVNFSVRFSPRRM